MSENPPGTAPGKDGPSARESLLSCGFLLLLLGFIGSFFVSLRLAAVLAAALVGVLPVLRAWDVLVRPAARVCFAFGVAGLVAGAWAVAYQPPPGAGAVLPAGLFAAGLLACLGGLRLASPKPSDQDLTETVTVGLVAAAVYLLVVGLVARFLVPGPGGEASLVVASILLALGIAVGTSRGRPWYRRLLSAALGLAVVLGVEALFFDRYRAAGLVVLLVLLAAWGASLARRLPTRGRVLAAAVVLLAAGSLAAVVNAPTVVAGVAGLGLLLALAVYAVAHRVYVRGHSGRRKPITVALALVIAVAVPAGGLAWLAAAIRDGPGYAKRYGTLVTVDVRGTCTSPRRGEGDQASRVTCPIAIWSVNGQVVSGDLFGTLGELVVGSRRVDTVQAYALGDRAYTRGRAADDRFVVLGQAIPAWLLLALPLGLVAWLPLELLRIRRAGAVRPRPGAPVPPARPAAVPWSHHTVPLSDVVVDALRLAAGEHRDGEPVTTGRALAALMRMDVRADWQRIWMYTGAPEATGLAEAPDPPVGRPPADWRGIPISDRLARALALLERLCAEYRLSPAGSGATMLALVADRSNGATDALLRHGGLTHAQLLRLVQTEILKLRLSGLSAVIPAATE